MTRGKTLTALIRELRKMEGVLDVISIYKDEVTLKELTNLLQVRLNLIKKDIDRLV